MPKAIRKFTFEEWARFILLAAQIRDEIDHELGTLLKEAGTTDTPEAWAAVHDRFNVLGDFDGADRIRELFDPRG